MSGVCAKHGQYVQPGEVCPYCESPPQFDPIHIPILITAQARAEKKPRLFDFDPPHAWDPTADRCSLCGKSGMYLWQTMEGCARK